MFGRALKLKGVEQIERLIDAADGLNVEFGNDAVAQRQGRPRVEDPHAVFDFQPKLRALKAR